jgi:DNA-binding beta-propeller fold protein YncE
MPRPIHVVFLVSALSAALFGAQAEVKPINDLPNPYRTVRDWGKPPGGSPWAAVTAVEMARDGGIYVIHRCSGNSCAGRSEPPILKFDKSGKLLKSWGEGMFVFPHGATVDAQGNLWVTDQQTQNGKGGQVFKFSPEGKVLMALGKAGVASAEPGFFDEPTDVLVSPSGDIFVTEGHSGGTVGNHRVSKFSKDGKFIKSWGKLGTGNMELDSPHTIAMDSRGRLFVGDRGNNRIFIYSQDGKLLDTWLQFSRASGIFIDKNDIIYVADSESGSIEPSRPEWQRGIRIGNARTGEVTHFIPDPVKDTRNTSAAEGVAVDSRGIIYGAEVGPRALKRYEKNP